MLIFADSNLASVRWSRRAKPATKTAFTKQDCTYFEMYFEIIKWKKLTPKELPDFKCMFLYSISYFYLKFKKAMINISGWNHFLITCFGFRLDRWSLCSIFLFLKGDSPCVRKSNKNSDLNSCLQIMIFCRFSWINSFFIKKQYSDTVGQNIMINYSVLMRIVESFIISSSLFIDF